MTPVGQLDAEKKTEAVLIYVFIIAFPVSILNTVFMCPGPASNALTGKALKSNKKRGKVRKTPLACLLVDLSKCK